METPEKSFWHGKKTLVGGGCGFLGSYMVPQLVEAGANVTVVDNLENGYIDNLKPVAGHVEFIEADLRDPALCARVTAGKDVVMNLAAQAYGMAYSKSKHTKVSLGKFKLGLIRNLGMVSTPIHR